MQLALTKINDLEVRVCKNPWFQWNFLRTLRLPMEKMQSVCSVKFVNFEFFEWDEQLLKGNDHFAFETSSLLLNW